MSDPASSESPLRIAALHQQAAVAANILKPGGGTPWEDRGAVGNVGGFGKTMLAGIFAPLRLLDSIRRLDTTSDAIPFVIVCGLFWAVSVMVHAGIILHRYKGDATLQINDSTFWQGAGILTGIVAIGFVGLVRVAGLTMERMTALDVRQKLPRAMYFNVVAYCLAPSLVAPLPIIGPVLATTWIIVLWILAAHKRLHAAWAASIIAGLLTGVVMVAMGAALVYVGGFAFSLVMGDTTTKIVAPTQMH